MLLMIFQIVEIALLLFADYTKNSKHECELLAFIQIYQFIAGMHRRHYITNYVVKL